MTVSLFVSVAAAVRPHPQPASDHVHSGLLSVPGSPAAGPGNSHQLQVRTKCKPEETGRRINRKQENTKFIKQQRN